MNDFCSRFNAKFVEPGFRYNSGENQEWENVPKLRQMIKEHVDSNFEVH